MSFMWFECTRRLANVERELRVQSAEIVAGLSVISRAPLAFLDGHVGTAAAAALRLRELVRLVTSFIFQPFICGGGAVCHRGAPLAFLDSHVATAPAAALRLRELVSVSFARSAFLRTVGGCQ